MMTEPFVMDPGAIEYYHLNAKVTVLERKLNEFMVEVLERVGRLEQPERLYGLEEKRKEALKQLQEQRRRGFRV